jgi:RimJ/RimL family protein N-acetyltransferase
MDPFETERLLVRQFDPSDALDFFNFNSNPAVVKYIRPIKSREASDAFLKENFNLYVPGFPFGRMCVVDKITGVFVGSFSILYLNGEANYHIGYALMPEFWGMGLATELVIEGSKRYFQRTFHQTLFAITDPENQASMAVLNKCGFNLSGDYLLEGKKLCLFTLTRTAFEAK